MAGHRCEPKHTIDKIPSYKILSSITSSALTGRFRRGGIIADRRIYGGLAIRWALILAIVYRCRIACGRVVASGTAVVRSRRT